MGKVVFMSDLQHSQTIRDDSITHIVLVIIAKNRYKFNVSWEALSTPGMSF
jgi:hypothetical protein